MRVELDYNSDIVTITSPQLKVVFDKIKNMKEIQSILEEVFNMLDESRLSSAQPYFDISLEKIDEDTRSTIGEW
jgi:hypothetical protein